MSALFVGAEQTNLNFMEGCFHLYPEAGSTWNDSLLLSTGMEDYYDSAFYFNAGTFHGENAGCTHLSKDGSDDSGFAASWSGYRFHERDPIVFSNGFRVQWRNGDVTDTATGLKCTLEAGGKTIGDPGVVNASSLSWVYSWG